MKTRLTRVRLLLIITVLSIAAVSLFLLSFKQTLINNPSSSIINPSTLPTPTPYALPAIPPQKILPTDYHIFQTFNNCGPAAFSMALRFYGITESQATLGQALRPYQVPSGDNDDKSVTLEEMAEKSKEYGFTPIHRPMEIRI